MVTDPVRIEDLFPSAKELFTPSAPRRRRPVFPMFAWIVAGAVALLVGQRIVTRIDRDL